MNSVKKIISSLLIFSILITIYPTNAFGNLQSNVINLDISDTTTAYDDKYHLNLSWNKPVTSSNPDKTSTVHPDDANTLHEPEKYEINMKNETKNEGYKVIKVLDAPSDNQRLNTDLDFNSLDSGSFYKLNVSPYHYHNYRILGSEPPRYARDKAPMDNTTKLEEVYYLSDIKVSATGAGSEINLTWDNPTIKNKDVFVGYRIYYRPTTENNIDPPSDSTTDVYLTDSSIIRHPDGRISYTINSPEIKPGIIYTVAIEPLISKNIELRKNTSITIDGVTYKINYSHRKYKSQDVAVNLKLSIKDEGIDNIRLTWNSLKTSSLDLNRVIVYSSTTPDFDQPTVIADLIGARARDTNSILSSRPKQTTYYKVVVKYKLGNELQELVSNIAIYDPFTIDFSPYKPVILETKDNAKKPLSINVIWEAFVRDPYDEAEQQLVEEETGKYIDKNLNYKIWISDNAADLESPLIKDIPILTINAQGLTEFKYTVENNQKVFAYEKSFTEYYTRKSDGSFEKKALDDNKIYYIKIIAERLPDKQLSTPAYTSHYINLLGSIDDRPVSMSKPPLRIKTENEIPEITKDSITIKWDLNWYEVFNEKTLSWDCLVGVDESGNILFGEEAKKLPPEKILLLNSLDYQNLPESQGISKIKNDLLALGGKNPDLLAIRSQKIRDNAKYEIHVVKYDDMEKAGGYDSYHDMLLKDENNNKWREIDSATNNEYKITSLDSNTNYAIFFRPFYVDKEGKKTAYLPAMVMGTTLSDRPPIEIKPTVPVIEGVSKTDTEITVRWNYTDSLEYDLRIGDKQSDYPESGRLFDFNSIKDSLKFESINDITYAYYTFKNLFPETEYFIWVRSKTKSVNSAWSNPIQMTTDLIVAPDPPKGLGLASKESLNIYNKENQTTFEKITSEYMILEWQRVYGDLSLDNLKGTSQSSDKTASWLSSENIKTSYLAKFDKLIANKDYYVRAKTRLVLKKNETGFIKTYHYIVEVSLNPDFLDPIEIIIPSLEPDLTENANTIIKDSIWSKSIKLSSGKTDTEYDGDKNPNLYPLPVDDFEMTYDSTTQTLNYRFRSGKEDNLVDQRFITKLVSSKTFDYKIETTNFNNKPIKNRVIEIPYTIISALEERKINLTIIAGELTVTLPYGSLKTSSIGSFGVGSNLKITLNENPKNLPPLSVGEEYGTKPQKFTIQVITPNKTFNINQFEKNIKLEFKLKNRSITVNKNVLAYFSDGNSGGYALLKSDYDKVAGSINSESRKAGNFVTIAKKSNAVTSQGSDFLQSISNINTKVIIEDLNNADENEIVSGTIFNNLVSAVAKNKSTVLIRETPTPEDLETLKKAKLYIGDNAVIREKAFAGLSRLYEIKSKEIIKNYSEETASDIDSVDSAYKIGVQKALKIGLIETENINPKENLTMKDFLYVIDIVLNDY